MSNYTKTTDFAAKDTLPSGNTGKIVRGTEFETEFDNIATAITTKADLASPTFSGTINITSASINDGSVTISGFLDEDNMATNSPSHVPTQQSVKAYVDAQTAGIVTDADTQTLTNKTLTSPVINTGVSGTAVLDEDNMSSDSDTKLATQQSIKAYVDTSVSGIVTDSGSQTLTNKTLTSPVINTSVSGTAVLDEDDMSSNSATQLATQQSIKAYVDTQTSSVTLTGIDDNATGTRLIVNDNGIAIGNTATNPTPVNGSTAVHATASLGAEFIAGTNDTVISGGAFMGGYIFRNADLDGSPPHYAGMWAESADTSGNMNLYFAAGSTRYETGAAHLTIESNGNISATGDITLGDTIYAKSNNQAFLKLKADQVGLAGTGGPHEWQLEADTSGNLSINYDKNGSATNDVVRITKGTSSSEVKLDLPSSGNAGFYASSTNFGLQISDGGVGGKTIRLVNNGTAVFEHNQVQNFVDLSNATYTKVAKLNISNIPTSASGLSSGDVYNDSGTLKIVT